MLEHTPGPWNVLFVQRNECFVDQGYRDNKGCSTQTHIADTYLEAAAPEMYDVCMRLLTHGLDYEVIEKAKSAVNKAKPSILQIEKAKKESMFNFYKESYETS